MPIFMPKPQVAGENLFEIDKYRSCYFSFCQICLGLANDDILM